jgi:hypothetical protein
VAVGKRGDVMPWSQRQAQLTKEAWLHIASPEEVYRELPEVATEIAKKPFVERFDRVLANDEIELTLIERNQPLINLGLACFGTNLEVYNALYKHSLEPARDATDAQYKRGLRIGCLSNESVARESLLLDFPRGLIGDAELNRVLGSGDEAEVEALVCNPGAAQLLEELYRHKGAFADIDQERWRQLVYISRKNEQIGTLNFSDTRGGMIHSAIFRLLEIAPLEEGWLFVLYGLLDDGQLNFIQTHRPAGVQHLLMRWAQLDNKQEGLWTSLSLKDEFRCLVASLYGDTYWNEGVTAKDVAERCGYYGNAELTEGELKAGYDRDQEVFVFAAMNNKNVLSKSTLRKLFEEDMVSALVRTRFWHMTDRYLKRFELQKKKWPDTKSYLHIREEIALAEKTLAEARKQGARIESLIAAVNGFGEELKTAQELLIAAAVVIAAILFLLT